MYVYRFENAIGQGPFYGLDGKPFTHLWAEFDDSGFYGCATYKDLLNYFEHQKFLTQGYHIYAYEVPRRYVTFKDKEVVFPKEWHHNRKFIAYNPFYYNYLNKILEEVEERYSKEEVEEALRKMIEKLWEGGKSED